MDNKRLRGVNAVRPAIGTIYAFIVGFAMILAGLYLVLGGQDRVVQRNEVLKGVAWGTAGIAVVVTTFKVGKKYLG